MLSFSSVYLPRASSSIPRRQALTTFLPIFIYLLNPVTYDFFRSPCKHEKLLESRSTFFRDVQQAICVWLSLWALARIVSTHKKWHKYYYFLIHARIQRWKSSKDKWNARKLKIWKLMKSFFILTRLERVEEGIYGEILNFLLYVRRVYDSKMKNGFCVTRLVVFWWRKNVLALNRLWKGIATKSAKKLFQFIIGNLLLCVLIS